MIYIAIAVTAVLGAIGTRVAEPKRKTDWGEE